MSSARQELSRLLATKSFRLGQFKLSSGGASDYYIDCRSSLREAPKGLPPHRSRFSSTKYALADGTRSAIGGLTMGADPIVVAVSAASGEIEGFLVRKADKQHGTGQRIEGFREKACTGCDCG